MPHIAAKIAVNKIDKTKLFKGKTDTYLDVILIDTPDSRYGDDFMVVQSVTKEEREQGIRGAILGNAKFVGRKPDANGTIAAPRKPAATAASPAKPFDDSEDVPF